MVKLDLRNFGRRDVFDCGRYEMDHGDTSSLTLQEAVLVRVLPVQRLAPRSLRPPRSRPAFVSPLCRSRPEPTTARRSAASSSTPERRSSPPPRPWHA